MESFIQESNILFYYNIMSSEIGFAGKRLNYFYIL